MMKININETKRIKFSVNVQGIDPRDLVGHVRLMKDDIEYGFPIKIDNGNIIAEIPPLRNVVKGELEEKDKFDAKLEIVANSTYIIPWKDTMRVEMPVNVEANLSEEENIIDEKEEKTAMPAGGPGGMGGMGGGMGF